MSIGGWVNSINANLIDGPIIHSVNLAYSFVDAITITIATNEDKNPYVGLNI